MLAPYWLVSLMFAIARQWLYAVVYAKEEVAFRFCVEVQLTDGDHTG